MFQFNFNLYFIWSHLLDLEAGLINWFEAGLEPYSFYSLCESLISHFTISYFLILAEVNLGNIYKYIIIM